MEYGKALEIFEELNEDNCISSVSFASILNASGGYVALSVVRPRDLEFENEGNKKRFYWFSVAHGYHGLFNSRPTFAHTYVKVFVEDQAVKVSIGLTSVLDIGDTVSIDYASTDAFVFEAPMVNMGKRNKHAPPSISNEWKLANAERFTIADREGELTAQLTKMARRPKKDKAKLVALLDKKAAARPSSPETPPDFSKPGDAAVEKKAKALAQARFEVFVLDADEDSDHMAYYNKMLEEARARVWNSRLPKKEETHKHEKAAKGKKTVAPHPHVTAAKRVNTRTQKKEKEILADPLPPKEEQDVVELDQRGAVHTGDEDVTVGRSGASAFDSDSD
jgi:hypothetical protein